MSHQEAEQEYDPLDKAELADPDHVDLQERGQRWSAKLQELLNSEVDKYTENGREKKAATYAHDRIFAYHLALEKHRLQTLADMRINRPRARQNRERYMKRVAALERFIAEYSAWLTPSVQRYASKIAEKLPKE